MSINDPVTAFLPCRKGSKRVLHKNIRPFGQFTHGLVEIKLRQLLACAEIDLVVLSTNDAEIIAFAESLDHSGLTVHHRSEHLSSSTTSTDDLVGHAHDLIGSGHILWTHVTSPFVGTDSYRKIIAAYRKALEEGYDSLMTATVLQAFLWNEAGPITYDRSIEKWPQTQTIAPVHEINSSAFLAPVDVYTHLNDRIGDRPLLYPMDKITAMDIDWEEDFVIAETLLLKGLVST
jgi:CMP-N-acetylneuraminic acid synthetase